MCKTERPIAELDRIYQLDKNVRVRAEKFGLLFYDSRGPMLHFVGTKSIITPEFFTDHESLRDLIRKLKNKGDSPMGNELEKCLLTLLGRLKQKGLIHEQ